MLERPIDPSDLDFSVEGMSCQRIGYKVQRYSVLRWTQDGWAVVAHCDNIGTALALSIKGDIIEDRHE